MTALAVLLVMTVSAKAMSYEQARDQALFLTDKMAYELNLTDAQYEAAYEINLDYLMGVNTYDELYGTYWTRRNLDLSYILFDWQYQAYCAATYFYRPLYWADGFWHFGIYARYPHRNYFFFDRPHVYVGYRGGHSWMNNGGRSWYKGRDFGHGNGRNHFGMRDGFDRGDYGHGRTGGLAHNNAQQRNGQQRTGVFGNRNKETLNRGTGSTNNRNYGTMGRNQNGSSMRNNNFGTRSTNNRPSVSPQQRNNDQTLRNADTQRNNQYNSRESSTRTTVSRPSTNRSSQPGTLRNSVNNGRTSTMSTPRSTFSPSRSNNSASFGGRSGNSAGRSSSPSVSHSAPSSSHSGGASHSGGGSFGGRR